MKNTIKVLFLLIGTFAFSQVNRTVNLGYTFIVDSINSKNIQDYRTVKIYLPKNYTKNEKYPVIYTLDAEWMFEPTVAESKILMDFDVIPRSIIVGVFHKNRNDDLAIDWNSGGFNRSSLLFYKFINEELPAYINSNYSTSGFNVLIGHSNSATFCHKVLTQKDQSFNGFVALSQNLFGDQFKEYISFINRPSKKYIFYFVASGKRDATPRLEWGMKLDSLFKVKQYPEIKTRQILYDADHSGVAAKGLNNGISFIFSDYRHYNDWDDDLIDSLIEKNIKPVDFINKYSKKIKNIYGVQFKVNQDDISLMQSMAQNDTDIETVQKYEIEHLGRSDDFYATYAQFYEYNKSYEKALDYWNKNIENNYKHNKSLFYFRRPVELLYKKMKQPERAIEWIQKYQKYLPEQSLYFNFVTAKIALESNSRRKTGLKAIQNCIENYKDNPIFDLKEAKEIELKLMK